MILPIRTIMAGVFAFAVVALAGGAAQARAHHHHHHGAHVAAAGGGTTPGVCDSRGRHCHPVVAVAAAKQVCDRHHRHCHAAVAAAAATHEVCGRHHRHCHTVATGSSRTGHEVCGRHHRHCHAVVLRHRGPTGPSESRVVQAPGAAPIDDNGTCKSVRIHGEWVQRCHLPSQ